jgi:hypothetical protein
MKAKNKNEKKKVVVESDSSLEVPQIKNKKKAK